MVASFLDGNLADSKNLQLDLLPLISALFCEVNPIPVKYALNVLGFDFGLPRLPLCELSSKNKALLDNLLKNSCTAKCDTWPFVNFLFLTFASVAFIIF